MSASSAAAPAPPLANGTSSTGQQSDFFPEDVIEIASEGNKTAIVTVSRNRRAPSLSLRR